MLLYYLASLNQLLFFSIQTCAHQGVSLTPPHSNMCPSGCFLSKKIYALFENLEKH